MRRLRAQAARGGAVLVLLLLAAAVEAADLPAGVAKALRHHKVPETALSMVVQAVDEPTPRLSHRIDEPRNPASVIKLVTTWVALDMLGPTHTWATRAYALGPIQGGSLKGDLLLRGGGDPYLLLEELWKMLGEIKRRGVARIDGDLIIDNSLYQIDQHDPAAFDGAGSRLYNVLPSAMMVNFKSIEFEFIPHAKSGKVVIKTNPALPNLTISNHIKVTQGACRGNATKLHMSYAGDNPDHVIFSGQMPHACQHYRLARTAMTPASYAFGAFKSLFQHWGGEITGNVRVAPLGSKQRPLVTWRSRPLAEVIRPLNKWSNNLMTRMLLYALGAANREPPISRQDGVLALTQHLSSLGMDTSQLIIDNGSGLSRDTRITAELLNALLRHAWQQPSMPEFVASLSIAGRDGTTRKRFRHGPEKGRMHLKTGSLRNVSAVGGYVHNAQGKTFAVSCLINYRGVNYGIGKDIQNALLKWVYQQN